MFSYLIFSCLLLSGGVSARRIVQPNTTCYLLADTTFGNFRNGHAVELRAADVGCIFLRDNTRLIRDGLYTFKEFYGEAYFKTHADFADSLIISFGNYAVKSDGPCEFNFNNFDMDDYARPTFRVSVYSGTLKVLKGGTPLRTIAAGESLQIGNQNILPAGSGYFKSDSSWIKR